jgi:RNA polymerase sigma-54 factor
VRLELGLQAKLQLQQKQVLAPQMIQAIEILQLPSVNLQDYVEQQLSENDALVVDTPEPVVEREEEETDDGPSESDMDEFSPDDWEVRPPIRKVASGERDPKMEALANSPGRAASLQDLLADQLMGLDLEPRERELALLVVYNLDDRGYLAPHRFVEPFLDATDEHGYLNKPLIDIVAAVDGVAAVKVPKLKRGVTPEQVAAAEEERDRNVLEAQQVLARIQHARALPGGASLSRTDVLLLYPLLEILEQSGGDTTLDEVSDALWTVQTLEPQGIAGRTLAETLLLQLSPNDLLYAEKRRLIERHLEDLERNRMAKISREMGLDLDEIQILVGELRGLDPRPGGWLAPETAQAIHPDVVVNEREGGDFEIDLVNSMIPPLSVSDEALDIAGDAAMPDHIRTLYRKRIDSARWLIEAIQQRQQTLSRVAQRIFHHQRDFLERGEDALRPLKMQTVADELGIHVSTVSRAIADKYVQTPKGVKSLKFFFTGGTETDSGEVESRHKVKNMVKAIIDAEDRTKPLSDDDVAAKLKAQGLSVARRTVTKYRKQLDIPSSRQRRQWV